MIEPLLRIQAMKCLHFKHQTYVLRILRVIKISISIKITIKIKNEELK